MIGPLAAAARCFPSLASRLVAAAIPAGDAAIASNGPMPQQGQLARCLDAK
jgi:hypothetical protein